VVDWSSGHDDVQSSLPGILFFHVISHGAFFQKYLPLIGYLRVSRNVA